MAISVETVKLVMDNLRTARIMMDSLQAQRADCVYTFMEPDKIDKYREYIASIDDSMTELRESINDMEQEVKDAAMTLSSTIKGDGVTVSLVTPKPRWNTKALDDYATSHVELQQFVEQPEPYARINYAKVM